MTTTQLLARSSWRFYQQHPAQLLLSILGIVLGVGIVTAVLITNSSSQRAFKLSSEALYGRTTHQLTGALGIDQTAYVALHQKLPRIPMAPVIQGHIAIEDEVYSILGLDPFSESAFGRSQGAEAASLAQGPTPNNDTIQTAAQALLQTDGLLISQTSLIERGLSIGQSVTINAGGHLSTATLASTFTSSNPAAATGLLIGDIAHVQTLLQRGNKIDRIDLIINEQQLSEIQTAIPDNLQLHPAVSRQQTMQAMTRGFHINLTAMSLLALVVGVFLIHNTMTFAVVQRRELFAIKRITGITARTLLYSVLAEAIVISLIGSIIGIALGYAVAHVLIRLTTQTINDLYFVLHVQDIWFSPWLIVAGLVLGIGSSVLAASLSAIDAASTSPVQARQRSVIEQRTNRILPLFAAAGLLIGVVGLLLAYLPSQSLLLGFAALMLLILGYGLSLPWLVSLISKWLKPAAAWLGISASLALGGIERNISRTGLAIAALCIAVSATFGVDIMIGSFRSTVDQWLGTTLQSDIYVSAPSAVSGQSATMLSPGLDNLARNIPGVRSVSSGRTIDVSTQQAGTIEMLVVDPHDSTFEGFELLSGGASTAWQQWLDTDSVLISEPLASKHRLSTGDRLLIFTELDGHSSFTITAVFRDFGSSHGKILMSRNTFNKHWQDRQIATLGIVLAGVSAEQAVMSALKEQLPTNERPLTIQSNNMIHRHSLDVFDRTFEVTRVLRWLTVGVAFVGIFSALLALHLERAREFAIIRAAGATQLQIMRVIFLQTLIMGLLAGLLALPLGWMMSEVLINVINVRSFGWSMQSLLPPQSALNTLILASVSAVLAGLYPAWKLSRVQIAAQLRDD